MDEVGLVACRHDHEAGQAAEISDVERAGMGLPVLADEPGPIDGKPHRQFLDRDVVHDLVVGALQKGRIDRGEGIGAELPALGVPLEIGRGRVLREGTKIALLSFGGRLAECIKAAQELATYGLSTTVADARFAKPLDTALVNRLVREHEVVITVEEGAIGGFGSHVLQHLAMNGLLDHGLKIRTMVLPDVFLDHDSPQAQYDQAGLNARHIVAMALSALGREIAAQPARA